MMGDERFKFQNVGERLEYDTDFQKEKRRRLHAVYAGYRSRAVGARPSVFKTKRIKSF